MFSPQKKEMIIRWWMGVLAKTMIEQSKVQSLAREDLLEEGMATNSSVLAWKTPWTEEPGELQSMGPQRVRHDWSKLAHTCLRAITRQHISASDHPVHLKLAQCYMSQDGGKNLSNEKKILVNKYIKKWNKICSVMYYGPFLSHHWLVEMKAIHRSSAQMSQWMKMKYWWMCFLLM